MDKVTGNKAVIASGANFKGQIKNAPSIEINGMVEADIKAEKLTIGDGGKFVGAANVELVVIAGHYDGNMDAGSIWATATAEISGKIQYKTIQLDRGAALNCRFIHNWKQEKATSKKTEDSVVKEGGIDMKGRKTSDEITKVVKTKTGNTELTSRIEAVEAEPKSVMSPLDEETGKSDGNLQLFRDRSKKATEGDKKLFGKRLGIFGFGSKVEKLPDVPG